MVMRVITDTQYPAPYLKQHFESLTNEYCGDQSWIYLEALN